MASMTRLELGFPPTRQTVKDFELRKNPFEGIAISALKGVAISSAGLAVVASVACGGPSATEIVNDIQYGRDHDTELCFAVIESNGSISHVECNPKVLAAIKPDRKNFFFPTASELVQELQYRQDPETDLCYAVHKRTAVAYHFTGVPCNSKVQEKIKAPKEKE